MGYIGNHIKDSSLTVSVTLLLFIFAFPTAPANAFVYWSNSSGSGSFFDWSGGGSNKGLFGSPTLIGDSFSFSPSNFRAENVNGIPSIKSDRLEFNLSAHSVYALTGIQITEYGDYGILDSGKVLVSGTMFVINLNAFAIHSGNFVSTPASPIANGNDEWSAHTSVTGIEWTNLKIVLNNNLMAISSPWLNIFY